MLHFMFVALTFLLICFSTTTAYKLASWDAGTHGIRRGITPLHSLVQFASSQAEYDKSTRLNLGSIVEWAHNKKLYIGSVVNAGTRSGDNKIKLTVQPIERVEEQVIDVGQLINIWNETYHQDQMVQWNEAIFQSSLIMNNVIKRKSQATNEFWADLTKKGKTVNFNSEDLAYFMFRKEFYTRRYYVEDEEVLRMSAENGISRAQRIVAAHLLFQNDCYFRRMRSKCEIEYNMEDSNQLSDGINVIEGGYGLVIEDRVYQKQAILYLNRTRLNATAARAHMTHMQHSLNDLELQTRNFYERGVSMACKRALELYALNFTKISPRHATQLRINRPPKLVSYICQGLGMVPSIEAVRDLLISTSRNGILNGSSSSMTGFCRQYSNGCDSAEYSSAAKAIIDSMRLRRASLLVANNGLISNQFSNQQDLRLSQIDHPPICVDVPRAKLFDDAFSVSRDGEVMIHIADVASHVCKKNSPLEAGAKERAFSLFRANGQGSMQMLPVTVLNALKLSTTEPNDVITVAFKIDPQSKKIQSYRVFSSVIGPVQAMSLSSLDQLLLRARDQQDVVPGFSKYFVEDILFVEDFVRSNAKVHEWVGGHSEVDISMDEGNQHLRNKEYWKQSLWGSNRFTVASDILDILLSLYSHHAARFCLDNQIPIPIVWANRMPSTMSIFRRFATKPLRNWISLLQQKQLKAALRLEHPLTKGDCADAVRHYNSVSRQWMRYRRSDRYL